MFTDPPSPPVVSAEPPCARIAAESLTCRPETCTRPPWPPPDPQDRLMGATQAKPGPELWPPLASMAPSTVTSPFGDQRSTPGPSEIGPRPPEPLLPAPPCAVSGPCVRRPLLPTR